MFVIAIAYPFDMRRHFFQARFAIQKSRPGLGHGLFATANLSKGDFVLEYTGKKIPTKLADEITSRYLFEIDRKWTVDGSVQSNLARYINHSCEPNCECVLEGGRILIYASRDIEKGEELSFDYGEEYFDEYIKPMGCKCHKCRLQGTGHGLQSRGTVYSDQLSPET
ncbi:MAG: hypothetical protein UY63_C0005G0049 [Parcubacteria group bacterium GW2011_GWA2_51_10]|nr:MAG: hypothetical protein UY63_C0005G0049 [Parcubacteria group bacterium GW2011_GWA2_51_10]